MAAHDEMVDDQMLDALGLEVLSARRSEKWQRYSAEVLPSFLAEMDLPLAEPVLEAIRNALDRGDLGYAYTFTTSSQLQSVFANWLRCRFGWSVDPAMVIPFPDTMRVVEVALEQFTERGDAVVVDVPAYPPFFEAVTAAGRVLVPNGMKLRDDGWRLNLPGLAKAFADGAST
ncbi:MULTISPECIES: beta C-S lyase family protein [unclassified Frankia]